MLDDAVGITLHTALWYMAHMATMAISLKKRNKEVERNTFLFVEELCNNDLDLLE